MIVNHNGKSVDFNALAYQYLVLREGQRFDVYEDHKGILTVGIGHKVVKADQLQFGDKISEARCLQLFNNDFQRLKLNVYCHEYARLNVNQRLAIGSFVWCHGDGDYKTSRLRKYVGESSVNEDTMFSHLKGNWDVKSPKNQERNRRDFEVFYKKDLWSPIGGVAEKVTEKVKNNPLIAVFSIVGLGLAAILLSK